ncbi:MAG: phosphotransferase [Anaerolineales bacterium]|nr:phosphotransferase [Anaerolineales bacterium]
MEQQIISRFNDAILQEAMRRYSIAPDHIQALDAFESFIYAFRQGEGEFILRIGHSLRKAEALIWGEVDWINHLARGGVSVARAVLSVGGNLVEAMDDGLGGQFFATAFVKARGQKPWEVGWSPEKFVGYGRLIGKMHALAVGYLPPVAAWKRPEWDDVENQFVERYLPASEVIAHEKYRELYEYLVTLPKDDRSYGLIHQDAHQNNFMMDTDGTLTLYDFDDCAYSWFVSDLAIVLFYIAFDAEELGFPTMEAFTADFMSHFLRGYREEYALDPRWLREIPHFLKLRELELYAVVFRDFDVENIDDWWIANFMRGRKARIEAGLPFVEVDFEAFAVYL